jgi:hypothetical protein
MRPTASFIQIVGKNEILDRIQIAHRNLKRLAV